ncbi:MAG: alpha/beta hydrolase [Cytophagales bacterium]|nr:alpha/beta hydrolase [Armatimonadota bacterium]
MTLTDRALTLVLLHYFGGSGQEWNGTVTALGDTYDCLALTLRGHGGTSDRDGYGGGIETLADDVAVAITDAAPRQYVLVGHSMGGKVALVVAARQPVGLRGLFLLAPSPPTPEPITDADRANALASWGDRAASEDSLRKITRRPLPSQSVARFVEDNLRTTEAVWRWWYESGSRENISEQMDRVAAPVRVLVGAEDPVIPPKVQRREVISRLADARLEVVPDAGHLLPDEVPSIVAAAIRQFGESLTPQD